MILQIIFLIVLLIFLYFLSRKNTTGLYSFFFLLSGNRKFSVAVLSVILLPGTVIHELSHFLLATLLRVETGELTVYPTIEENGEVRAGKLMLGKVDPFRHSIIGVAPMIIGLLIIFASGKIFIPSDFSGIHFQFSILNLIGIYLFFATSITMFSSKKDLESLVIAGPITILILLTLYLIGVRILLDVALLSKLVSVLKNLNFYLLVTSVIDYLFLVMTVILVASAEKLFKKKIVSLWK